jgi:hypothetical protein
MAPLVRSSPYCCAQPPLPGLMHTSSVMSLFSTKYLGPRFVITCEMIREAISEAIRGVIRSNQGPRFVITEYTSPLGS